METTHRTTRAPRAPDHFADRHPSRSRTHFLASDDDIPTARDTLTRWLDSQAPHLDPIGNYEILLAANELFVNAFEHGSGGGCLFDMRRVADLLTITVTNNIAAGDGGDAAGASGDADASGDDGGRTEVSPGTDLADPDTWAMPSADGRSGRGLAIVKRVADEVTTEVTAHTVAIIATFDLRPGSRATAAAEATLAL